MSSHAARSNIKKRLKAKQRRGEIPQHHFAKRFTHSPAKTLKPVPDALYRPAVAK